MKTSNPILFLGIGVLCNLVVWTAAAADKFGQQVPEALEATVQEARQLRLPYLDGYDPAKSVELLTSVIEKKPDYYRAYFNLGLALHEVGDYEKAKSAFDAALKIREKQNIKDNTLLNTAGWVSLKNGDFQRAEELLLKTAELTKGENSFTEGAVYANLGVLYFLTQKFDKSKQYLLISRDTYGSDSAQFYLDVIEKTEAQQKKN